MSGLMSSQVIQRMLGRASGRDGAKAASDSRSAGSRRRIFPQHPTRASSRGLRDNPRRLDVVQVLELGPQVRVPLALDAILTGARGGAAAVAAEEGVRDFHALDHLPEGGEGLAVERAVAVGVVDEDLGRAGIR